MSKGSDPREALKSLFGCLQNTFKRFDRPARKKAWQAIQSGKGKDNVNNLLNNPSYQVVGIYGMMKFKEWFRQQEKSCSE